MSAGRGAGAGTHAAVGASQEARLEDAAALLDRLLHVHRAQQPVVEHVERHLRRRRRRRVRVRSKASRGVLALGGRGRGGTAQRGRAHGRLWGAWGAAGGAAAHLDEGALDHLRLQVLQALAALFQPAPPPACAQGDRRPVASGALRGALCSGAVGLGTHSARRKSSISAGFFGSML